MDQILDADIKSDNIQEVLIKAKNWKARGEDEICHEYVEKATYMFLKY